MEDLKYTFSEFLQGLKDANDFNPENPEQKILIEQLNEKSKVFYSDEFTKLEKLKRLNNIINQYENDLNLSENSKPIPVGKVNGKTYFRKPYNEGFLRFVINLFENIRKHVKNQNEIPTKETPEPENKFLNIFIKGGYELFCYLNKNYNRHNEQLPTKYSNLFRYLQEEQYTQCTQKQYFQFIQNEYGVKMTKVFTENYSTTRIKTLLTELKSEYKNQSQST